MDNNNFIREKAQEWFTKANSDLRSAEILIKEIVGFIKRKVTKST